MNKIININLAGRLIPIDEQAYDQLLDYLNRLKLFFSREEGGDEIVRDMEDRMGELFQDKLKKGAPCIMAEDVNAMIAIMGSPEQIENEAGEEKNQQAGSNSEKKENTTGKESADKERKHLGRSKNDKMIGGVCGGLASYFNVDPIIIRIALILITLAWGAGLIVYLLLWALLPENDDEPKNLRRRLYRNPKQKVVGGVCSGIAAYANIDPVIPRVIFVAPLLGLIFFGILDNNIFFFPMFVGGLPTLVLLYLILWASLPEANTIAEKLEMRGEKVDVQNLSMAIKGNPEETETTIAPKKSGLRNLFSLMVKIFIFFVLAIVLVVLASVIIAIIATLCGLAVSSVFVFPFSGLITENETQKWLLWICAILTLILPFIAITKLLVRIVTGRRRPSNKWINITLSTLFIAGIFGLFWIGSSIASDFKTPYRKTFDYPLIQPTNDTLLIKQAIIDDGGLVGEEDWGWDHDQDGFRFRDDTTIAISNLNLRITNSPDSLYHLQVQKSSYGSNSRRAQAFAEPLVFSYKQEGNVLFLPKDFILPEGHPFRGQKLSIEVQVPVGKVFKTEDLVSNYYTDRSFVVRRGRFQYRTVNYPSWDDDHFYKMGADGPIDHRKQETDTSE
jgi:phage shock protein PspC (stress-responsive transcriptional regulator)